jgi:hypothetical protein
MALGDRSAKRCSSMACRSIRILDFGLRPIAAGGRLGVLAAVLVLVFDNLRVARHTFISRRPRSFSPSPLRL